MSIPVKPRRNLFLIDSANTTIASLSTSSYTILIVPILFCGTTSPTMVTTSTEKACIVQLKDLGMTDREVANKENVNHSTVSRVYTRYGKTRNFYDKRPRTGRPRKLDAYDTRIALQMLANGTAHDVTDLKHKQFPLLSINTVCWQLKRAGLNGRIRRKKPLLRRIHKVKCHRWARELLGWVQRIGRQCGSPMSQNSIYLGQMGINGAGEGQGRNSVTATPTKQSNTEGGVLWSGDASKGLAGR